MTESHASSFHRELSPRDYAVSILHQVLQGRSLADLLPHALSSFSSEKVQQNRGFFYYLLLGTLREYDYLEECLKVLLNKPLQREEGAIKCALILALYEAKAMGTAEYAVVHSWGEVVKQLEKPWAVGLINAILRRVLREGFPNITSKVGRYNLPKWLVEKLDNNWKRDNLTQMSELYRLEPPITLRLNREQTTREDYLALLAEEKIDAVPHQFVSSALVLKEKEDITSLPLFLKGGVSVQDASAQLSSILLAPKDGEVVLDACAAPGGKTTALLERASLKKLVALDLSETRLSRVKENIIRIFDRIPPEVELVVGDARSYLPQDNSLATFDAILVDAPCSGTGILHKHPDIKRLRRASDISPLVVLQAEILAHCWQLLKPGGRLLYATCSVLKEENEAQIYQFLANHLEASEEKLVIEGGIERSHGVQILPTEKALAKRMDGFYYALLKKRVDKKE